MVVHARCMHTHTHTHINRCMYVIKNQNCVYKDSKWFKSQYVQIYYVCMSPTSIGILEKNYKIFARINTILLPLGAKL